MDRSGTGPPPAAGRAERFEDERRRIIETCFNKKDVDGSLQETYITHVRVVEYSTHPTAPPPPEARTPDSEKPRVIIVAVRKTGRVRIHKSKENSNGTFSIGKTWNLDDMTQIESYTSSTLDSGQREWAGDTGFTVHLGKPYFWQAPSEREKKFFIASLIKIYGKYTNGKAPELVGFDARELDQVLGGRRQAARPPPSEEIPASLLPGPGPGPGPGLGTGPGQLLPNPSSPGRLSKPTGGRTSPVNSIDSSRSQNQSTLRRLAGVNRSQDSMAMSFRSDESGRETLRSRNGVPASMLPGRPPIESLESQKPGEEQPPERRRPPMDPLRPQGVMDRDLVPAPLMSPTARKDPISRNMDRGIAFKSASFDQRSESGSLRGSKERLVPDPPKPATPEPKEPAASASTPTSSTPTLAPDLSIDQPPESPEVEDRPGLGPMIKSKKPKVEIAGSLWKAAAAVTAFKPRPGGAGERLRQMRLEARTSEPDGITSVVPAPSRRHPTPEPLKTDFSELEQTDEVPHVTVTGVHISRPTSLQSVGGKSGPQIAIMDAGKKVDEAARAKEDARRSVVTGNDAKYLSALGIDPSVLDIRSEQFTHWLDHFGWVPGDQMRAKSLEEVKVELERELNKAQAGGWLSRFREEDERVEAIKRGVDVAINECDELDNLLTLYSVELSTLSDDIAYIEAQGQGLQVQTANQKLLKKELESLLETCAITADDLNSLRVGRMDRLSDLEDIESSLVVLFKAMAKIDPNLGGGEPRKSEDMAEADQSSNIMSDYGKMRIVQEKKEMYIQESAFFLRRLVEFMARRFDDACAETRRALDGALSKKADSRHHDAGRDVLWKYSPLMLYAREVDLDNWNRIIQIYQEKNHPTYRTVFRDVFDVWKRSARRSTGEDSELLFTSQAEKHSENIATTARKLTVKKSQNLARSFRTHESNNKSGEKSVSDNRSLPYEIFGGVVDDLLPLVEMEQNFIIDFFHATTLEQLDFQECVLYARPQNRRGGDLRRHRLMEPDRELARRVTRSMEVIFAFLDQDLQGLVDWVLSQDPLQGVGVLAILDRKLASVGQSNQDFLNTMMQKLHGHLEGRFMKFVDQQVLAIEETKIQINKRKGVISFVRVFPGFSAAVETMMESADPELSVRQTVNGEYERILKAIFNKLKAIARDSLAGANTAPGGSSAEAEDKEAINYHIMLIENMNHFVEETDTRGLEILDEWQATATTDMAEHLSLYLAKVMRRPLGKLLDYIENIEAQLQSGKSGLQISGQPSNSKTVFNKVLGQYDAKEVRKGIEALKKRVEKHFSTEDEAGGGGVAGSLSSGSGDAHSSQSLVNRVLRECEKFYAEMDMRISTITTNVYGGESLFEWPRADAKNAFNLAPNRFL